MADACHQLLITLLHIPMQACATLQALWSLQSTPICHTFPNTKHAVKHQRTSTSPTKATKNSTTAPFWTLLASSKMTCPWHLRQIWRLCIMAARLQYPSKLHLTKWGTHNLWRPSRQTLLRHKVSPLASWPQRLPTQWTNNSTGWNATVCNDSSYTYGTAASSC